MNRNSVRSRPMPTAPDWAISGSSSGSSRLACSSTVSPSSVSAGRRRSLAKRCRSRAKAVTARRAAASVSRRRVQHHGAGRAVHHRDVARPDRMRQAGRAQHRRHAQRAQHDRGMALGAAFLGRHAGKPGRIEQRRVRRPQRFADQHRAFGQAGEAAERRARQVAHQPPADLAHLLGAPRAGWRGRPPACRARPAPGSPRRSPRPPPPPRSRPTAASPRSAAARRGSGATEPSMRI